MDNYPESQLTEYKAKYQAKGYEIESILGTNKAGGRVTYLATKIEENKPVVLKEFQFAKSQVTWSDYEAYEREIEVLKQLSYPNIPRYLATIETPSGFALVQEYKRATPLSEIDDLSLAEIKEIAVQILEILCYLQSHKPPIFHRDIKPENILIERNNDQLNVYLIDFGFARKGGENIAMSSVIKGTLGFMPPEQLYNQRLTTASDLYGLGMTIVCLLTKIPSYKIGELIDHQGKLNYKKHLTFNVDKKLIKWLDQMIATNLNYRFSDANTALKALKSLDHQFSWLTIPKPALISGISKGLILLLLLFFGYQVFSNKKTKPPVISQPPIIKDKNSLEKQLKFNKHCKKCDLRDFDLSGMNLNGINLMGADLEGANLKITKLQNANLKGANLSNTDLSNSDLTNSNLIGANLENANLSKSYLGNANLMGANLINTNLAETVFWNADLTGAKINLNNIKDANLKGAILPNGLKDKD